MNQASAADEEEVLYSQLEDRKQDRVARASSIAVPAWMLQGYSPLPTSTQTCSPMAYRSTGFLRPQAEARRATFYNAMTAIACENGISPGLFDAMIIQESRYNPVAVSSRKAFGLAQLLPGTARQLGVNSYDPVQNLRGGARYLRQQLDKFGHVHLALAAYNAGPARIRGAAVPPIRETRDYVATILANWSRLARPSGVEGVEVSHPLPRNRAVGVYTF
jgi:soluble lytic murein transglycosylase-like protein